MTFRATETDGTLSSSRSATVRVYAGQYAYVSRIILTRTTRSSEKYSAEVAISGEPNSVGRGAQVTADWYKVDANGLPGEFVRTDTAVTNRRGVAKFDARGVELGTLYTLCVKGVTKEGYTYEPEVSERYYEPLDAACVLWDLAQ